MFPVPLPMRESSAEVPGIAVIRHQLSLSDSSELSMDSIRVYPNRVYLRIGLRFNEPAAWRTAGIDPNFLMTPETFHAAVRYQDGVTVPASSLTSDRSKEENNNASPPSASRMLVQVSSQGAGLQWYVDFLISPLPAEDVVFSAGCPRIGLAGGEWLLPRLTIAECLEVRSAYVKAREAAQENGHTIQTNLNRVAEITARLAHLDAMVDFGSAKRGWEPAVQLPLQNGNALSISEILSSDAVNVTIKGTYVQSYLLEVPDGARTTTIIAFGNDVARAAEALVTGLRQ